MRALLVLPVFVVALSLLAPAASAQEPEGVDPMTDGGAALAAPGDAGDERAGG